MNLEETLVKVQEWGLARKITTNGNSVTQIGKLFEEVSEIAEAIIESDHAKFEDAIGDSLVVVSMISDLTDKCKIDFDKLRNHYEHEEPDLLVIQTGGKLAADVLRDKPIQQSIDDFILSLHMSAKFHHTTLERCFELAYEEIKDRTGHLTSEGNFVKDETPLPAFDKSL